jgi:hypothetical protein
MTHICWFSNNSLREPVLTIDKHNSINSEICFSIMMAFVGLNQLDPSLASFDQSNQLQQATWRPFLPRYCDCMTTTGQCVSHGSYQCSFNRWASIVQCVGKNRWISIRSCFSSCRLWANGEPYCMWLGYPFFALCFPLSLGSYFSSIWQIYDIPVGCTGK